MLACGWYSSASLTLRSSRTASDELRCAQHTLQAPCCAYHGPVPLCVSARLMPCTVLYCAVLCCTVLSLYCTQIVANIHYHDDAALEVHRINPLLAAGKCVLSEHSSDPELDELYSSSSSSASSSSAAEGPLGVVTFASYDEFVPEAVRLLASMTRREAMVSTARSLMWERHSGKPSESTTYAFPINRYK